MAVTTPPSVTALPPPPSTASPSTFDTRADAFLGALPTYQTEQNALAANVYANAVDAAANAVDAAANATAAASSKTAAQASETNAAASAVTAASAAALAAGATIWESGTTYAIGAVRYSPASGRVYRRLTAGAGTTDPSADGINWKAVDSGLIVAIVSTTTQAAAAATHYALTNAAQSTLTLPASPALGDSVAVSIANGRTDNIIARNGQTIMDLAEDMTVDNANATVTLRFINSTWRLV